jgi:hypothetical protein
MVQNMRPVAVNGDTRWLAEDPAFRVLEMPRGLGRELVRRGMLRPQQDGVFRTQDMVQAALLKRFRHELGGAEESAEVWASLRVEGLVDEMVERALSAAAADRFDVVIDQRTGRMTAVVDEDQFLTASSGDGERRLVIVPFRAELAACLEAFRRRAHRGPVPAVRRGRPRKSATIHELPPPSAAGG